MIFKRITSVFFFFSSRRRHTRCYRDWSSDVCSSDLPRALVATLIDRLRARVGHRHLAVPDRRGVDLTSREWEVLDLMREGLSTHGIATRLRISDVTVRRHIGSVLKKLEVRSREEAMKLLQSA